MDIVGNKKALSLLDKILEKGKISNAYLFSGPEKVGKFTVAVDFAQKLIGNSSVINPDLIIVRPVVEEKKGIKKKLNIKIEEIRGLERQLSLTSTGGKYKVVIIDEAEKMNKAAQNSLLKTLEEPNSQVVLILVTSNERKLLATILSRCFRIKFSLVNDAAISSLTASGENRDEIIFWSLGRPGMTIEMQNDVAELEFRREALSELKSVVDGDVATKFALAEAMSKDINLTVRKFNFWMPVLRECLVGREMVKMTKAKALAMIEAMGEGLRLIGDTNSNARLILENIFLNI